MKRYPAMIFMATHGKRLAMATLIVLLLLAVISAMLGAALYIPLTLVIAAVAAAAALCLLAEVLDLLCDTLMPR